jgi:hypothetical protein
MDLSSTNLIAGTFFTIISTSGAHGIINPSGSSILYHGDTLRYIITPDVGYLVDNVLVDGVSQGNISEYTFINIIANHTIVASFIAE